MLDHIPLVRETGPQRTGGLTFRALVVVHGANEPAKALPPRRIFADQSAKTTTLVGYPA
jgi:hypothetical protein